MNTEKSCFPALLADDLWVLGNYYFNLYLIRGNKASALIEVGISAVTDIVIRQLETLGIAPDYLVVTHPHADHITGLPGLLEHFPQATPVFGNGAQKFATHPKASEGMIREDRFMAKMLSEKGVRPGRPPLEDFHFPEDHITIADGHETDLGGLFIRFMEAKGHSPGNIVVHIPDRDALILSDSLGFHFPGRTFLPLFFTGFSDYMETLNRLESLSPAIVGPAHQGPLTGRAAAKAFTEARETALSLHSKIIGGRSDTEAVAEELFKASYKDEFTIYTEGNIRNCCHLLVRRSLETLS